MYCSARAGTNYASHGRHKRNPRNYRRVFAGIHAGDTERLRKVLHPAAFLYGYYMGSFRHQSLEDWMDEVASMAKPSESSEPFDMRIVALDVTGRVATVKADALYQGLRFTDYLTLMKIDHHLKIVNKAYHHD